MAFSTAFALSALVAAVSAHGTVSGVVADGTYYGGWQLQYYYEAQNNAGAFPDTVGWSTEGLDNGFIDGNIGYDNPDVICHKNAAPGAISAKVAAGGTVDFQWTTWPDSHIGPVITYLANCGGDCSTVDKTTLQFVKIDAVGMIDGASNNWATTKMIANNGTWTTTIPTSIAPGNYVARHEIIALHGAGSTNGAQNYPQCINLEITGSGTDALSSGTLGTALYTNADDGILFNPYQGATTYTIPGPALYSGASTGGDGEAETPAPVTSAASAPAATPTSAVVVPTPSTLVTSVVATPTSAAVTSVIGAVVPTPTGSSTTGKPLPEGYTMKDLLEWVTYALSN